MRNADSAARSGKLQHGLRGGHFFSPGGAE